MQDHFCKIRTEGFFFVLIINYDNLKMKIKINNKNIEVKVYDTILKKAIGQMFRWKAFNLIFQFSSERIVAIHMFFVFCKLDVVWLNSNKEVIDFKTLKPFTCYTPKIKSQYVLEFPEGYIKKYGFKIGKQVINC